MEAKYVFSRYPVEIEKETLAGEAERREIRSGDYGLAAAALLEVMSGKLTRLGVQGVGAGPAAHGPSA